MRVLLDTHVLLWALAEDRRLSAAHRVRLDDPATVPVVSAASLWEIAIKRALGRLDVPDDFEAVLGETGCVPLAVTWRHAWAAGALPRHHEDPFDRMLVAQAQIEALPIMSADTRLPAYDVTLL